MSDECYNHFTEKKSDKRKGYATLEYTMNLVQKKFGDK